MTARYYNFTKQNDVLMKARRRFTKQNGVVKQILAGWTKRNGVVEQVYSATRVPAFCTIIATNSDTFQLFVTENIYASATYSVVSVQNDYWADGATTQLSRSANSFGFNYAGGNASEQSVLFGFTSSGTHELFLGAPTTLSGQTLWGWGYEAIIKTGNAAYVSPYDDSDGMKPVYVSATTRSKGSVVNIPETQDFGTSLTLYNGRGVVLGSVSGVWGLFDFDESTTNKISYVDTGSQDDWALGMRAIYTPNGQDCVFSLTEQTNDEQGYAIYTTKLYKYNIQTKSLTSAVITSDGWSKMVIGTYGGYIFVAARNSVTGYLTIEKYNLSLSLVDTHDIEDITPGSNVQFEGSRPTITSNNKYVGLKYRQSTGLYYTLIIDLSLF